MGRIPTRTFTDERKKKMPKTKAYWNGYEIYDIEYHEGWCEILFLMNGFESPITGTGRYRVRPEDIVIETVREA